MRAIESTNRNLCCKERFEEKKVLKTGGYEDHQKLTSSKAPSPEVVHQKLTSSKVLKIIRSWKTEVLKFVKCCYCYA